MNNHQVADRFWDNHPKPGHSISLYYEDGKLFSYSTCILQRFGKHTIANGTKYSQTTSRHQYTASIWKADITLYEVPRGVTDLVTFAKEYLSRLDYILNS